MDEVLPSQSPIVIESVKRLIGWLCNQTLQCDLIANTKCYAASMKKFSILQD